MTRCVLFFGGFFVLIYGARFLVDAAASIAKKHKISNLVIGLSIVAMGTSLPELVVNIIASHAGIDDVAVGNILGSNNSNILLILGLSAMVYPLEVMVNHKWSRISFALEIPFAILAALIVALFANVGLFQMTENPQFDRVEGIILILFFLGFMFYAFQFGNKATDEKIEIKDFPVWKSMLMIPLGIAGLAVGGRWIVNGAKEIALMLGLSEAVISLTIIAVGTSLPELATCLVATFRKNPGMVIGTVIGSNIFNVFFVLGLSAVIRPLNFNSSMNFDVLVGLMSTLLLFFFLFSPKKNILGRWQGGVLFMLYIIYVTLLVLGKTSS